MAERRNVPWSTQASADFCRFPDFFLGMSASKRADHFFLSGFFWSSWLQSDQICTFLIYWIQNNSRFYLVISELYRPILDRTQVHTVLNSKYTSTHHSKTHKDETYLWKCLPASPFALTLSFMRGQLGQLSSSARFLPSFACIIHRTSK